MRFGLIAQSPVELLVSRMNVVPRPLIETQLAFTHARLVMAGVRLGIYPAVADEWRTAAEVAERCGTDPAATEKLLFALAGAGYLRWEDGRYQLEGFARKWLLPDSPSSLVDKLLLQYHEWEWIEHTEEYVRSGDPLDIHGNLDAEQWDSYQRGMRSMAGAFADEAVKRMPVPKGATAMLDIGGSHGYYSVALCRRHERLRSVVLDLPEAVERAAPLLAAEGMGDRVIHRAGDALREDLGAESYDLILISQLVHHFSSEQNRELAARVARALRPGGVFAIADSFRAESPAKAGQFPALLEFYFALTSQSGTWSPDEMADWQRDAGLEPRKPIRLRSAPSGGIQAAAKAG